MNGSSFDSLARAAASRRTALRAALVPALTGLGAAAFLAPGAEAKKKKKKCKKCKAKDLGDPCTSNKDCCTNETNRLCAFSNLSPASLICCGGADANCSVDDDCCGPASCDSGHCTAA